MSHIKKLSPLVGESVSGADERGKLEQKRKTDYFLCIQACHRARGKQRLRKKNSCFYMSKNKKIMKWLTQKKPLLLIL